MNLRDWMLKTGHDAQFVADEVEKRLPKGQRCSASGVRKWRDGERVPRPARMKALMELTDGNVTPNDFAIMTSPSDVSSINHEVLRAS